MQPTFRLAIFLACTATAAAAGPYDGVFKQAANSECAMVGVDGGSVRIAEDIFYGVEVECRMLNPVNVVDMDAQLFSMQCSGADQLFTERAMLMNKAEDDGIIMVWDGYAFVYDRCPDPGDPAETPSVAAADPASADPASTEAPVAGTLVAVPEGEALTDVLPTDPANVDTQDNAEE